MISDSCYNSTSGLWQVLIRRWVGVLVWAVFYLIDLIYLIEDDPCTYRGVLAMDLGTPIALTNNSRSILDSCKMLLYVFLERLWNWCTFLPVRVFLRWFFDRSTYCHKTKGNPGAETWSPQACDGYRSEPNSNKGNLVGTIASIR